MYKMHKFGYGEKGIWPIKQIYGALQIFAN